MIGKYLLVDFRNVYVLNNFELKHNQTYRGLGIHAFAANKRSDVNYIKYRNTFKNIKNINISLYIYMDARGLEKAARWRGLGGQAAKLQ